MSNLIMLVAGDNLPNVQVALTNEATGLPLDMSPAGTTVLVKMRAAGTTSVIASIPAAFVTNGSDGLIQFAFAGTTLQVDAGLYEFEVDIDWNGAIQTVFDILRARVRERF